MRNNENASDMIEVTETAEIQKLLYVLMKEFHSICERHNLYYVVFGGTMLGAVRHQAMIPWDDDIDVCMPRKDYEKFCEIVNSQYNERFTVGCYPQSKYIYEYGKFCLKESLIKEQILISGYDESMLFIDVFPVDGYPDCKEEKKHFDKLRFYYKAKNYCVQKIGTSPTWWKRPYAVIRFMKYLPYRLIGYQYFIKKEIEELTKYDFETSEYVSMQGAGWNEKGKLPKETLMNRRLYKFGDMEVWGISDYDEHLTKLYGDYMTPPPKEKQVSNHSYKLYIRRDKNYG